MIKPQTLKGFRDFLPEEASKRQYVINTLKKVFESFGFEPLETPALEYEEILLGKYGQEGDKLIYRFTDNGKRKVALRYDQTVPLARVIAQYGNELPMPFKRYQIQPVWRAENTQKGRYREFLQCDADIVGSSSPLADAEILALSYATYKSLGLDIKITINDRALLNKISERALPTLDKLNKIGEDNVIEELRRKGFDLRESKDLINQARASEASIYIQEVMKLYEEMGCPIESLDFDGTLVRGLNYYTGIIFEVVIRSNPTSPSLCGGGRYDNLIGMFANNSIPAIGFAIGFDRTIEIMEQLNLFPQKTSNSKILVTTYPSYVDRSIKIVKELREIGMDVELYLELDKDGNPLSYEKQLKYADQKGIPYAVIIGPDEAKNKTATVKNLKTGEQKVIAQDSLPNQLSSL